MTRKATFMVVLMLLALSLLMASAALAQYTWVGYNRTAAMGTASSGDNGRGFAVNTRTGSAYKGWIYYCNREVAPDIIEALNPATGSTVSIASPGDQLPHDCFVDPVDDGVYVASLLDRKIYKMAPDATAINPVTMDGDATGFMGRVGDTTNGHRRPRGLYVTGSGSNRTMYIAAETEGQVWTSSDNGASFTKVRTMCPGWMGTVCGITADSAGNVYILDRRGEMRFAISKWDANGNLIDMQWDQPLSYPGLDIGGVAQDIQYVNNNLGEFLMVSVVAGSVGNKPMRVYRYRLDGTIADVFGNGVSSDTTLNGMLSADNNGLAYMDVDGDILYVYAMANAGGTNKPAIVKVQMPVMTGTGTHPVMNGPGPFADTYTNITVGSLTHDEYVKWSGGATPKLYMTRSIGAYLGAATSKDVWTCNADGSGMTPLTFVAGKDENYPAAAPDNNTIVYVSTKPATFTNIFRWDAANGEVQLTFDNGKWNSGYPDWSKASGSDPNNAWIAFASGRFLPDKSVRWRIWKMRAVAEDGSTNVPILVADMSPGADHTVTNTGAQFPVWSPDGTRIAFVGWLADGIRNIYVVNADGTGMVRLTDSAKWGNGRSVGTPTWSPDGTRIAFSANWTADAKRHIWIMNADGTNPYPVTGLIGTSVNSVNEEFDPSWGPNNQIAFQMFDYMRQGGHANTDTGVITLTSATTPGSISGKVISGGGVGVEGVSVYLGFGSPVLTDANGDFTISGVAPGAYTLTATKHGYGSVYLSPAYNQRLQLPVMVKPGQTTNITARISTVEVTAPMGVSAIIKGSNVSIRWRTDNTAWIYGYNVYYSNSENGPWTKLNADPLPKVEPIEFIHTPADLLNAFYMVTAVSTAATGSQESSYSYIAQAANNLVHNPSFEIGTPGSLPEGWYDVAGTSYTRAVATDAAADGAQSLKMTQGATAVTMRMATQPKYHVPVAGGTLYNYLVLGRNDSTGANAQYGHWAYAVTDTHLAAIPWAASYGTSYINGANWQAANGGGNYGVNMTLDFSKFVRNEVFGTTALGAGKSVWFDEVRWARFRLADNGNTGEVWGIVTDPAGNALGGAIARIGAQSYTVAADGYFYFRNVPNGNQTLTIDGAVSGGSVNFLNAGGAHLVVSGVTMQPGTITGQVTYSDSTPVAGAVVITNKGGSAVTNSAGMYTINNAIFGDTKIMASVAGWKPSGIQTIYVPAGGSVTAPVLVIDNSTDANKNLQFTIVKTATPPTIDGVVNTATEWKDSNALQPFNAHAGDPFNTPAYPETTAYALYDNDYLYVAFDATEPDIANLAAVVTTRDSAAPNPTIWADDNLGIFIDPLHRHNGPNGNEDTYQIDVNPNGALSDQTINPTNWGSLAWSPAETTAAATKNETTGHWFVELKIPFSGMSELTGPPTVGQIMGMLFTRHRVEGVKLPSGTEYSSTNYTTGYFKNAAQWNDVVFGNYVTPPVVCSPEGFVKGGRWNLVSVPADPTNADPLVVFSGIDVANASFQYWKNNVEGGGYQSYGELFGWTGPVVRGIPYWFLEAAVTTDKQICFEGAASSSDFELTIPAHVSAPFWVMFGTPFPNAVQADNILFKNVVKRGDTWLTWADAFSESNPTQRIVDSNAQGWNAADNRFVSVTPNAFIGEFHQVDPWWGYWLLVYDANELKIKFPKP